MRLALILLGITLSSFCFSQSTKNSFISEDSISSLTISIIGDSYRVDSVFVSVIDHDEKDTIFGITSTIGECRLNLKQLRVAEKKEYTILLESKDKKFKPIDSSFEIEDAMPRDFVIEITLFERMSCSIKMMPVLFDEGSSELILDAENELLFIAEILKENPSIKIEIRGYVDCLESQKYGVNLALERAESAKAFLASKMIDSNRIRIFADKKIYRKEVCDCAGTSIGNCTAEQLALKRRISFSIGSIKLK